MIVSVSSLAAPNSRASWAEIDAQHYEVIDYDVGIDRASAELCKIEPLQHVLFDGVEPKEGGSCESRMRTRLDEFFRKPECMEGGFYGESLQCCLDAISGALQDHHDRALDANIIPPAWDDVLDMHCDPADVCHRPSIATRPDR